MFFDDEIKGIQPIVPDEDIITIFKIKKEETGNPATPEEFDKIYNHIEEMLFQNMLYNMCLEGLLMIKYDFDKKEIVYSATKLGIKLGNNFKEKSDKTAIDSLLNSINNKDID